MDKIVWLNLDYYTPLQLSFFIGGAVFWIINYIIIVRNIFKLKFVEMPGAVLAANFAWEFLWSWVFQQNMGMVLTIGYRAWFFLDILIVWGFYKYGFKQVEESMQKQYKLFFTFGILAWTLFIYVFVVQGLDNPIGAPSAYVSNLLISGLYITQFYRLKNKSVLSFTAAWTKGLGTGLVTVMCVLRWPENHWVIIMGALCFIMDCYYTYIMYNYKRTIS
jgi:hypothetical protein